MVVDAFAAIGLAANIAQFIEYIVKLTSESRAIYASSSGASDNSDSILSITQDLNRFVSGLVVHGSTSPSDPAVVSLAQSCQDEAGKLITLLNGLRGTGKSRKWESFRQAVKTLGKKEKIGEMQRRLDSYRGLLTIHLVRMVSDSQSSVLQEMKTLASTSSRLNLHTADQLNQLQSMMDDIKIKSEEANSKTMLGEPAVPTQAQTLSTPEGDTCTVPLDIIQSLRSIVNAGTRISKQQHIVGSLWYTTMRMREHTIDEAHAKTF
ncbi:hypothetical protein BU16DRAFT_538344 [Lophium mytilinum]|uniref:Fungal N-terminal domain-containing protein n=1 Tax=Lophium mytilinum TaxID=390894 RepID=A0A6A6R063_9PEZI|nr:hypothetical protein BU16DRAFT_538344 [Lophium mytilinum]